MNRQYTRYIPPAFKQLYRIFTLILLTSFFTPHSFAKSEITYGPIQNGQSLWTIAEETRPSSTVSIEQIVYAFYHLNPNAFQSNNMNLLKTGSFITIPNTDVIKKISQKEAKQSLSKHAHALALLRTDAKQLKKSKQRTKKYRKRIKKIQQHLAKYRYESRAWNKTYKRLVKAKRRYTKSKRKTKELRKLLLEKSMMVATAPTKQPTTPKNDSIITKKENIVIKKLSEIQDQLGHLEQSNQLLIDKSKKLDVLNKRITILEDELGFTDQLVVQLKNTVENIRDDLSTQSKKSDKLQKTIEELKNHEHKESLSSLNNPYFTQQNNDIDNETNRIEALRIKLSPTEQATFAHLKVEENPIVETPIQESVPELKEHPQIKHHSSEIKHASFHEIEITTFNKPRISSNHQHKAKQDEKPDLHLKFITLGGYINGFILIFVLFILLFRRSS